MSKTQNIEEVDAELNATAAPEVSEYRKSRDDEYYERDAALSYAITFHKNNGGMMTPPQLVEHANVFLAFLKGETK